MLTSLVFQGLSSAWVSLTPVLLATPCHSVLSSKLDTVLQFVANHVIEFPSSYSCLSLSYSLAYSLQSTELLSGIN